MARSGGWFGTSGMVEDTSPSPFKDMRRKTGIVSSSKTSDTRAFRAGERIKLPGTSALGTAGYDIPAGVENEAWEAPAQSTYRTERAYQEDVGKSGSSSFWDRFIEPYKEVYYQDMFDAAKGFYFTEKTPADIMAATDPEFDVSTLGSDPATTGAKMLPRDIIEAYQTGADSPYLALRDIKRGASEELEGYAGEITAEEQAIVDAKELYKEQEDVFEQEKAGKVATGILEEQQAESTIAQQGYEIAPSEAQLELAKEAGDVRMGETYLSKRLAQEKRQGDITTSIENIEGLYDDASKAYRDIGDAEIIYDAAFNQGSQFWNAATDIVLNTKNRITDVQSATEEMFDEAISTAKDASKPYKGTRPSMWKESHFSGPRTAFKAKLDEAQDNINNLSAFLPSGEQIAAADLAPFEEGGEYAWLAEDAPMPEYSYDDTETGL